MEAPRPLDLLAARIADRLPEPAVAAWFLSKVGQARAAGVAASSFAAAWSGAGRRLGRAALSFAPDEATALAAAGAPFVPEGWAADEAGRAALLVAALEASATEQHVPAVAELYRSGEVRERQALMKALPHLPAPERFADVAAEAVRTSMMSVFEALACDNLYPARHLPAVSFNQLVVKALQNGVPLDRLRDLDARRSAELARMVEAFASERRAAGRAVPADVDRVLGPG